MVKIADKIEMVNVSTIYAYKNNAKQHPDEQIVLLMKSIKEFGFNVPLILDSENRIIAGHGRLLAAKKLDIDEVPVIRKNDLTEEQIKSYRIMDNKASESSWNQDVLKMELEDLKIANFDLQLTGFSEDSINDMLNDKVVVDEGISLTENFEIAVECENETQQQEIYEKLKSMGLKCRILAL